MKSSVKVVAIGEAVVEIFRKYPDQSFDKIADFVGPFPSGAPAIFADTLAKLGCPVGFVGPVGKDEFGRCILKKLKEDGVDIGQMIILPDCTTGTAFTTYFSNGRRKFLYHMKDAAPGRFSPEHIKEDYFSQVEFLHITGNVLAISDSSRKACHKAANLVKKEGGKISFDPNLRPELLSIREIRALCDPFVKMADILLPGEEELKVLAGTRDLKKATEEFIGRGIHIIAIKQGKRGSMIFTPHTRLYIPPFEVEEIDPTGAGDCYDAGFIFGLLKGWELEKIGKFSNAVGALAVTKRGGMEGLSSLSQVIDFMRERENN
ncbi:MAG TPA: sugar kinase [Candidatus Aerophobetes bacterium]|uniref:Sugar kinase n=1 Tax=Aerophobetes bacterium TaxID=2030807 RepID=A0A662DM26_UNCAE|nr:MAG: sugar kinase [Candidatus Aerophobetes bacterium]HDN84521.1 sugar kinase [Candidatus Aerophobetes bacterium]